MHTHRQTHKMQTDNTNTNTQKLNKKKKLAHPIGSYCTHNTNHTQTYMHHSIVQISNLKKKANSKINKQKAGQKAKQQTVTKKYKQK